MSIRLITVQEAKSHSNITDPIFDIEVLRKIEQASAVIMRHAKYDAIPTTWISGSPPVTTVPELFRTWTFVLFGELWENRESGATVNLERILEQIPRDPTFA